MKQSILDNRVVEKDMREIAAQLPFIEELFNKTILVTGATGMLASYLTLLFMYLNRVYHANITLLLFVRNYDKAERIFGREVYTSFVKIYTEDINKPLQLTENIDYIIHAASLANPDYYRTSPVEVALPNVLGTYNLLELAREKQCRNFLFFSSGNVYGALPDGAGMFNESVYGGVDTLLPQSCYGESKRMGETFCCAFTREYGVSTVLARIAHTYAPTMDIEHDPRVFASFMKCIIEGRDIEMLSDGSAMRPFLYISDAVTAFLYLLLRGRRGEAYNVANTEEFYSIRQLAEILARLRQDIDLKVICRQRPAQDNYVEDKLNRANRPSNEKLRALGWMPQVGIREGFLRVFSYFRTDK